MVLFERGKVFDKVFGECSFNCKFVFDCRVYYSLVGEEKIWNEKSGLEFVFYSRKEYFIVYICYNLWGSEFVFK